jgi:hypothetical protein
MVEVEADHEGGQQQQQPLAASVGSVGSAMAMPELSSSALAKLQWSLSDQAMEGILAAGGQLGGS